MNLSFYHLDLWITPDVLIPRLETEHLVELILQREKSGCVLDLCTGSGCIGLALKQENPAFEVTLSDISEEALGVARTNAVRNGLEVETIQSDLFRDLPPKLYDILVSNPPYVTSAEYKALDPSVKDCEPKLALHGGWDGLKYYRAIVLGAAPFLRPGAHLYLESSPMIIDRLPEIFSAPCWTKGRIIPDQFGRLRYYSLEYNGDKGIF
ncbi:MAG: protein-(glutamine-N5) methyltransferase, release factor-specific [Chlamydiae bacterium RIFCSPHIGHO2_12_FULL_49_11]|nr:MAG: protein-(glutamine-N5) methyltransferase, release factor-specific [Chlamydiae bacterium RIFCSPHIGHO2_12_FULL_49_11]